MITSQQYNAVADWLEEHSKRPRIALRLWRKVFDHLDPDGSGRIVLSRNQLAELLGVSPRKITEIMSELAGEPLHAIIKQAERVDGGEGRGVTYYMNPFVGEFMRRRTKEEMQQYPIPGLGLAVIDGDKT